MNKAELLERYRSLCTTPDGRVFRSPISRALHTAATAAVREGRQIVFDAARAGVEEILTTPADAIEPEHPRDFARRHLRGAALRRLTTVGNQASTGGQRR